MLTSIRIAVLITVLGVTSNAALADPASEAVPSRIVRIAGLDLQSAVGADMAYARIRRAAKAVCAPAMSRSLALLAASERCETQAIARAVAGVDAPTLSLVHALKTNRPLLLARQ